MGTLELEWNLNLLGGGGNPEAYYRSGETEVRHDTAGAADGDVPLAFGNRYEGVDIAVVPKPATAQEWFAVETVSNSEGGFERVYQGSCLTQRWSLELTAGHSQTFAATFRFTQSRDRAAEEAAS
jgi:hypothetical protein